MDGVIGPDLRRSPGAGRGKIDAEGASGAVGRQHFDKAVPKLRKCRGERVETGSRSHTGEGAGYSR